MAAAFAGPSSAFSRTAKKNRAPIVARREVAHEGGVSEIDPDIALVRACQAAGPDASACFAELMRRHSGRIRARATRILGNETEADDVVQEVFSSVHRFLGRYEPNQPFHHWLSVVTLNACRIELRKRNGRDRRHAAFESEPLRARSSSIDVDPILRRVLTRAVDDLPQRTRECILLRVVDGFRYKEIAEQTGLSVPAVKMRVMRGLTALRDQLRIKMDAGELETIDPDARNARSKTEVDSAAA